MEVIHQCIFLIKNKKFNEAKKILNDVTTTIQLDAKWNLLGIIESELKNYSDSVIYFKKALKISPNNTIYNFNLGIALEKNLKIAKSIQQLKICIKKNHQVIDCLISISNQLINKKKLNFALQILLKSKINDVRINYNIAFIYNLLNEINLAKQNILRSLDINSKNIESLFLYAEILKKDYNYDDAIVIYKKIIDINPKHELSILNLANTYGRLDKYYESIKNYKYLLKLNKNNKDALLFLTQLYLKKNTVNKSKLENFEQRFNQYKDAVPYLYDKTKQWNGEFVNTLLIWGEQGIGDHIFFSKYLLETCQLAKKILFQTDRRLINLFQNFFTKNNIYNIEILDIKKKVENYNAQAPIGSLLTILKKKPFADSKFNKLLESDKSLINNFSHKINKQDLNIGISWKSLNNNENYRNINLTLIFDYFKNLSNIKFHNLQFGYSENEINNGSSNHKLTIWKEIDYTNDLDSVAALIENMDYVLTVQNTVAHMSCALQKKTLLLAPLGARWYWGSNDIDKWYGSAQIFRQHKLLDWSYPLKMLVSFIEDERKK